MLLIVACAACSESVSYWTIPEPFVRPGSRVAFFKSYYQTEKTAPAWKYTKGDSLSLEVSKTQYTTLDLTTCAVRDTTAFPGTTRELAWAPDASHPDLWITLDRDGPTAYVAHSLHGRSIELRTRPIHDPRWREASAIRFAIDHSDETLQIWRVGDNRVETTLWDAHGFEEFTWWGARAVAVATTSQAGELELFVADQPGGTATHRLSAPTSIPRSGRLLPGGTVIGFLNPAGVDLFAVDDGHRVARYEMPPGATPAWPASTPGWFAYSIADRTAPVGTCRTSLVVVDLLRNTTRNYEFNMCLGAPMWLADSPILVFTDDAPSALGRKVAIDVVTWRTGMAPASSRRWAASGHTAFYDAGTKGHRSLMAIDLEHGVARALTADLGDVRFMALEPSSRTIVITRPGGDVLLYRLDAQRLDLCTLR